MKENVTVLTVHTTGGDYDITVARGALSRIGELLPLDRRVLIVTDDGVPASYAASVAAASKEPVTVTIASGEASKSLASLERLCRVMLQNRFGRGDCVVAVGGGIVGDLAGFAAACYMRGIDFYNVPTTLLSQVDSSIGGKVAVNLDGIKNTVGAFYQPRAVVIDPDVLATLPERQISSGLAEALKMSATHDADLFAIFERGEARERLDEVIVASLKIKRAVVESDEKETGLRRVLNFGHTVGHGIESLAGFDEESAGDAREQGLYHGECVALGMLPMCSDAVRARLLPILRALALPTETALPTDKILDAMTHDKKAVSGGVGAVFVDEIGSFRIEKVSFAQIECRIRATFSQTSEGQPQG